ncbi:bile acid:sodium symporter family protein [Leeuwenhoekiella parthenopeia]|uniref:Bile acid:sodium symporter n=1 Tax=Leeuwenhoekiella parthenopeia TaxID=2890320 RepID=A0ABS8GVD1_9FLAO|nr:bile acid:sodium symporter family protein [Leeuwenhoekiella parthenopeia]MCC4213046.1 bile acid:sodium symporter [Leeuwenhoekiella parthenopeia]
MRLKLDPFVSAIFLIVAIAYFFPQFGIDNMEPFLNKITTVGIGLIFFFYGLKLSPAKLKAGLSNWKLHLLIQGSTFFLFPVLVLLFRPLLHNAEQEIIWLAFFFLAALPSTVSTSVVMVSIAEGNLPSAIFNASISGIIGILVTPLWIGLFINTDQVVFDFSDIYVSLILQVLLPLLLGIFLQLIVGSFVQQYSKQLALFDKSIILLIIYKSFAKSFSDHLFSHISLTDFLFIIIGVLVLFTLVYSLISLLSRKLGFSLEDRITAQFCGTKKSLVHGTVFSKIIFQNAASVGIILLPLMLFHIFQIVIISMIASHYKKMIEVRVK